MNTALKQPIFYSAYPEVTKACARLGIYTIPQLFDRVRSVAKAVAETGLWVEEHKIWEEQLNKSVSPTASLSNLLQVRKDESSSFVNPWDVGRKRFRPLAVFVAYALGRLPTYLFGTSQDLEKMNKRAYETPSPQREHVRRLLRAAINPQTGKTGITDEDFRQLSSVDAVRKGAILSRYFDAGSLREKGELTDHIPVFSAGDGTTTEWGQDCAAIINGSVEDVFYYSAEALERREGRILPMFKYVQLNVCEHIPAPENIDPIYLSEVSALLRAAMSKLTKREKEILTLRIEEELPLRECGQRLGCTGNNVWYIERKAYQKIESQLKASEVKSANLFL